MPHINEFSLQKHDDRKFDYDFQWDDDVEDDIHTNSRCHYEEEGQEKIKIDSSNFNNVNYVNSNAQRNSPVDTKGLSRRISAMKSNFSAKFLLCYNVINFFSRFCISDAERVFIEG